MGLIDGWIWRNRMRDISVVLEKAIKNKSNYTSRLVSKEIEELPNIWCRLEDDSSRNWYTISLSDGKTVIEDYGYLSYSFPVALLKDNCPKNIYDIIYKYDILYDILCDSLSCEPKILEKYIDAQEIALIDDRFMDDNSLPFNEELFLKIDEGINYINPYRFNFENIK